MLQSLYSALQNCKAEDGHLLCESFLKAPRKRCACSCLSFALELASVSVNNVLLFITTIRCHFIEQRFVQRYLSKWAIFWPHFAETNLTDLHILSSTLKTCHTSLASVDASDYAAEIPTENWRNFTLKLPPEAENFAFS